MSNDLRRRDPTRWYLTPSQIQRDFSLALEDGMMVLCHGEGPQIIAFFPLEVNPGAIHAFIEAWEAE